MTVSVPASGLFQQIPAPVRGALWMMGAGAMFSSMALLVRHTSQDIPPLEVVFFRNALALMFMLPWLARAGIGALHTRRIWMHVQRSLHGIVAMGMWFTAMSLMPLAEATALGFTAPLFGFVGAALFLGETIRWRRWAGILVGFAGALVILRPGIAAITTPALLAVSASLFVAASSLCVKSLSRTEAPNTVVIFMNLLMTPVSLIPALFVWQWPSWPTFGWLVVLGLVATLGHLSYVRAFATADASVVLPYDYARLPFVAAIAFVALGEVPDIWTWVGAAVIFASTIYVSRREIAAARAAKLAEAEAGPRPLDG
jgi:drug/metabolite transporter (DMT)-like permease